MRDFRSTRFSVDVAGTAGATGASATSDARCVSTDGAVSVLARLVIPAADAHRLTQLCETSCFAAAPFTPSAGTSASTASRSDWA